MLGKQTQWGAPEAPFRGEGGRGTNLYLHTLKGNSASLLPTPHSTLTAGGVFSIEFGEVRPIKYHVVFTAQQGEE